MGIYNPVTQLSQIAIDTDKDWDAKKIENLGAPDSGDDAKRHDSAPEAHKTSHEPAGADPMTVDAVAGTGSLRTLGAGAQQAMPGNAAPAPGAHESSHVDGETDEIDSALDPAAYPMLADTIANIPAAGVAGRFYWSTDEHILYRDTGAAWVKVAVADYPDLDSIPASFAPSAHKDSHDPQDGSDPLDAAAPVKVGAANAEGSSHSLARADHVHEREHAKYTNAEAVSAAEAAGLALASGKNIKLIQALTADHTWSGITAVLTAGTALTRGQAVYVGSADSKMEKAKADATGTMPAIALLCPATLAENVAGEFLLHGFFRDDSWSWAIGGLIYISQTTAGLLTQTRPATATNQVQIVGIAITATILLLNPSYELVEVA